ncbi:MAG: nucleotidyltransferase domain-containing protein [Oscillospiraceae bacterium]|nr:nucleotidyltransferase domain-containing protein [Oscillospiraceae bacterium]
MDQLYHQLARLAQQYQARRLVLFGSRSRGDNHERSDIDLAVYGMPEQNRGAFWLEAEELPTLLKLDIVYVSPDMNPAFLHEIEKDGVTLYDSENGEL